MGDSPVFAVVEEGEGRAKAHGDIVGGRDGALGGATQAVGAHHADIHPGDDKEAGAAPAGVGDGVCVAGAVVDQGMAREVGAEFVGGADGPHAGAAAAMGDAEGFVEVEVADVHAEVGWAAEANLGVGAVHVNEAAGAVDGAADVADAAFEEAVVGGVGDHDSGEVVFVGGDFLAEVGVGDVALVVAGDGDDAQAGHDGGGRVGAVRGDGDEAGVAVVLTASLVVAADGEQSCQFALGAGIGLKGDCGQAGDGAEPALEVADDVAGAAGLIGRAGGGGEFFIARGFEDVVDGGPWCEGSEILILKSQPSE